MPKSLETERTAKGVEKERKGISKLRKIAVKLHHSEPMMTKRKAP